MTDRQFYFSGLKFSCKRCSACCRHDSGFVYLSEKDLEKLTTELKISRNHFIQTYCRWVMNWQGQKVLSLKEKSNKDCIFWDSGCIVYIVRPLQCRTYPFWENIVASLQNWEIAACGCPGINNGAIHTGEEIEKCIKSHTLEPVIYG